MSASIRFEDWLEERLADPEFREEWEASAPGFQVALLRMRRGLTQAELAELVGTTQSSIARLESGRTEPRLSFLRRVVGALGGQLTIEIAGGEDAPSQVTAAPTPRAVSYNLTVAAPFSWVPPSLAEAWQVTSLRSAAIDRWYCLPDDTRCFTYPCASWTNADAKTVVLQ